MAADQDYDIGTKYIASPQPETYVDDNASYFSNSYTTEFWGLNILQHKVREIPIKIAIGQNSVD